MCVWLEEELFDPICLPKKLHNIFSNLLQKLTFNLRGRKKKKKKTRQCGLCLELIFSGEHYNQLLPSQTSFPILCDENVIWLYKQSEMRDTSLHFFLMFTFPNKGDTLDFFSLSGLSFSLWCFLFWFCPDSVFTRESHGQVCSARSESHLPFTPSVGWKRANEC